MLLRDKFLVHRLWTPFVVHIASTNQINQKENRTYEWEKYPQVVQSASAGIVQTAHAYGKTWQKQTYRNNPTQYEELFHAQA
jgi:hypothetical protein